MDNGQQEKGISSAPFAEKKSPITDQVGRAAQVLSGLFPQEEKNRLDQARNAVLQKIDNALTESIIPAGNESSQKAEKERIIDLKVKSKEVEAVREIRRELLENSEKYDESGQGRENRIALAEKLFKEVYGDEFEEFTEEQKALILRAHEYGSGKIGAYSKEDIAEKARILAGKSRKGEEERVELFDGRKRRLLLEAGIAGDGDRDDIADQKQINISATGFDGDIQTVINGINLRARNKALSAESLDRAIDELTDLVVKKGLPDNQIDNLFTELGKARDILNPQTVSPEAAMAAEQQSGSTESELLRQQITNQYKAQRLRNRGIPLDAPLSTDEQTRIDSAIERQQGGEQSLENPKTYMPDSLEGVAQKIEESNDKWTGKILIRENGRITGINIDKFFEWYIDELMYWEDFNADGQLGQWGITIGDVTSYRPLSFNDLLKPGNEGILFKSITTQDSEGKPLILKDLRQKMQYIAWVLGYIHDSEVEHRQIMYSESELPKTLSKFNRANILVKPGVQKIHYSMSSNPLRQQALIESYKKATSEDERKRIKQELKEINDIGNAYVMSLLAYRHIMDRDMLGKIFGQDSVFVSRQGFERFLTDYEKQNNSTRAQVTRSAGEGLGKEEIDIKSTVDFIRESMNKWFDMEGSPTQDFYLAINPFNQENISAGMVDLTRKMVQHEVLRTCFRPSQSLNDEESEKYRESKTIFAQYVETLLFRAARPTLLAQQNDFNATDSNLFPQAFDAAAKIWRIGEYRRKGVRNLSSPGEIFTIPQLNNLAVSMWDSITTVGDRVNSAGTDFENGPVMLQWFEGRFNDTKDAKADYVNLEKFRDVVADVLVGEKNDPLRFRTNAQGGNYDSSIQQAFGMLKLFSEKHSFGLDKLVKRNVLTGAFVIDYKAADELGEIYKMFRYWARQYGGVEKMSIRIPVMVKKDGKATVEFIDKPLEEVMLGEKVREFAQARDAKVEDPTRRQSNLARGLFLYYLGTQLSFHAHRIEGYAYFNEVTISNLMDYLKSLPNDVMEGENGEGIPTGDFFSKEEIKSLEGFAHIEPWRLNVRVFGILGALLAWYLLKDFTKTAISDTTRAA